MQLAVGQDDSWLGEMAQLDGGHFEFKNGQYVED
jgi:hypothetical protein